MVNKVVEVKNLTKIFGSGSSTSMATNNLSLTISQDPLDSESECLLRFWLEKRLALKLEENHRKMGLGKKKVLKSLKNFR